MTTGDLTTLANVKLWLQDPSNPSSSDDAILSRLITSCSGYIQAWLNRTFASATYTAVLNGKNTKAITLPNYPITAISSLQIDGVSISAASPASTGNGYVFSDMQVFVRGYLFSKGFQNINITYTAGYSSVPYEIEQACIEMIGLRYKERSRIGQISQSLASGVVSFSQKDMSDSIKTILNNYKRVTTV